MNEELKVLLMIADSLKKTKIAYVISGSMASNYYTTPRMTRDIDIVVELKAKDISNFIKAFESQFLFDPETISEEVRKRGMFNLIHKEYIIKADFILRKETDFQESVFRRRKKAVIEGKLVWVISAEDLVLAKLLWARESYSEMQLRDVEHLLKTVENLDRSYVEQWVPILGLAKIYKKVNYE